MLVTLSPDELDFVREMVDARMALGKNSKRASKNSESHVLTMGIAGEFAIAKGLGCAFNPFPHRGGDGHRRDLWRGDTTISVKTRGRHLPSDFLFPPGQDPGRFPDDYGVVGRWVRLYDTLAIVGYFSKADWQRHHTTIEVNGTRSGQPEFRNGYPHDRLHPIGELIEVLDGIEDAEIRAIQDQGHLGYLRNREYRGRGDLHGRQGGATLADTLPLDSPLRLYC